MKDKTITSILYNISINKSYFFMFLMSRKKPKLYIAANGYVFQGVSAVLGDCFCLRQSARGCSDSKDYDSKEQMKEQEGKRKRVVEELERVKYQKGDVGVIDSSSAGFEFGFEFIKRIHNANKDISWVLLRNRDLSRCISFAISQGVSAIMPDKVQLEYFRTAVNAVSAGQFYFDNSILSERASAGVGFERGCPYYDTLLTPREAEIFELTGLGNPVRTIAERLNLCPKTVDSHKQNIVARLGFENAEELLRQAIFCADCRR